MNETLRPVQITSELFLLRLTVGFLGQRKHCGWWECDFLDATGLRFLEATFPRTAPQAGIRSTVEAAARVHDQALGRKIGGFHLFRLPTAIEDGLEGAVDALNWSEAKAWIESKDRAMTELKRLAKATIKAPQGPVRVGTEKRILTAVTVQELAAHYHSAFADGLRCFPYFAADDNGR